MLFKEIEKTAQELAQQAPAAPGEQVRQDMYQAAQAPGALPPGQAAPTMIPNAAEWVGPKVSVFQNTMMHVPSDPIQRDGFITNELFRRHPYLAKYPTEIVMIREEEADLIGEVQIANDKGVGVSVPFAIRDGKIKPFVVMAVDGNMHALGDEHAFLQLLEGPMPVTAAQKPTPPQDPSATSDQRMDLLLNGPEMDNGTRISMLDSISKESSLLEALQETGVSRMLAQVLAPDVDVVQYQRVPYGVIEKVASADCFEPMAKHKALSDVPPELLECFGPNPFVTELVKTAADEAAEMRAARQPKAKTPVVAFGVEKKTEDVPGKGQQEVLDAVQFSSLVDYDKQWDIEQKAKKKGGVPPFGVTMMGKDGTARRYAAFRNRRFAAGGHGRVCFERTSLWGHEKGSMDPDEQMWLLFSTDGYYGGVDSYDTFHGLPLDSIPKVGASVAEAFKSGGGIKGYLTALVDCRGRDEEMVYGPIELVKSNQAVIGGEFCELVFDPSIKRIGKIDGPMGRTMYIPSSSKFLSAKHLVQFKPFDRDEYIGDVVRIEKVASNSVALRGAAVAKGSWEGAPLAGAPLSYQDAVLVLGATGVDEITALAKIANAISTGQASVPVKRHITQRRAIEVNLGFMKLAAAMPAQADRFLSIQMLGSKTLDSILDRLPELRTFCDDLAITTYYSQVGLGDVEETVAYQAMRNLQELLYQLERLAEERSMSRQPVTGQPTIQ